MRKRKNHSKKFSDQAFWSKIKASPGCIEP